jgi:hypothetical protein
MNKSLFTTSGNYMVERICNGVLKRGDERRCWHFVTCHVMVCVRLGRVDVAGSQLLVPLQSPLCTICGFARRHLIGCMASTECMASIKGISPLLPGLSAANDRAFAARSLWCGSGVCVMCWDIDSRDRHEGPRCADSVDATGEKPKSQG